MHGVGGALQAGSSTQSWQHQRSGRHAALQARLVGAVVVVLLLAARLPLLLLLLVRL